MLDSSFDISGKWFNKNTGNTVNVRNSVMDGDHLIIMTDRGPISSEEFMRDYIQVSDDMFSEDGRKIGTEKADKEIFINNKPTEIPKHKPEINLETTAFDSFDQEYHLEDTKKLSNNVQSIEKNIKKQEFDPAIEKFFNKISTKPSIKIDITWDNFPIDKLNTLIEYLDIDENDIISYIKKTYLQDDKELTNSIRNTFFNKTENEES